MQPNVEKLLTQTPTIIQRLNHKTVTRRLGWIDGLSAP